MRSAAPLPAARRARSAVGANVWDPVDDTPAERSSSKGARGIRRPAERRIVIALIIVVTERGHHRRARGRRADRTASLDRRVSR